VLIRPKRTSLAARLHLLEAQLLAKQLIGGGPAAAAGAGQEEEACSAAAAMTAAERSEIFQALLFIDFVHDMLMIDPTQRPTCKQLLSHEFLADADDVDVYWDANASSGDVGVGAATSMMMTTMPPELDDDDDDDDDDDADSEEEDN
jgi:hypothetical protein